VCANLCFWIGHCLGDTDGAFPSTKKGRLCRELCLRDRRCLAKLTPRQVCERLHGIVLAVAGLDPQFSFRDNQDPESKYRSFLEGKKKIQQSQQSLFSRYLQKFAKSLIVDHNLDLETFIEANPDYKRNKEYRCIPPAHQPDDESAAGTV